MDLRKSKQGKEIWIGITYHLKKVDMSGFTHQVVVVLVRNLCSSHDHKQSAQRINVLIYVCVIQPYLCQVARKQQMDRFDTDVQKE